MTATTWPIVRRAVRRSGYMARLPDSPEQIGELESEEQASFGNALSKACKRNPTGLTGVSVESFLRLVMDGAFELEEPE